MNPKIPVALTEDDVVGFLVGFAEAHRRGGALCGIQNVDDFSMVLLGLVLADRHPELAHAMLACLPPDATDALHHHADKVRLFQFEEGDCASPLL